ncbi:hypothetical protein MMC21_005820 [Puttea exsequens]|nr:hypothetical protein [Puttea exsequens]
MPFSASSLPSDIIISIVFGIVATITGVVTVYQGHRAWKLWLDHRHRTDGRAPALLCNYERLSLISSIDLERSRPPSSAQSDGVEIFELEASSSIDREDAVSEAESTLERDVDSDNHDQRPDRDSISTTGFFAVSDRPTY